MDKTRQYYCTPRITPKHRQRLQVVGCPQLTVPTQHTQRSSTYLGKHTNPEAVQRLQVCKGHLVLGRCSIFRHLQQHMWQAQGPGRRCSSSSRGLGHSWQAQGRCARLARVCCGVGDVGHDCVQQREVCHAVGDGACGDQAAVGTVVSTCGQGKTHISKQGVECRHTSVLHWTCALVALSTCSCVAVQC